jgi:gamma-glutamylcyclotransferase (GGCT)/AIG2-like uncharacterized protein YtfP
MITETNGRLFVYGTLRSGFQNPAYAYISNYFTLVGPGKVKGRLYDMGTYPAAIPVNEDHFIIGELYQINHPDELAWAMAQLDDYEGLNTEPGETPLYVRKATTVYLEGETTEAWVYWFAGDVSQHKAIDSGDMLQYVQQNNKN